MVKEHRRSNREIRKPKKKKELDAAPGVPTTKGISIGLPKKKS
jgi:hypothetical protein